MIKVYAPLKTAPFVDWRGRFFRPSDETELHELLNEFGVMLVGAEIEITGTPHRPLSRVLWPIGMQMARCGSAWGIRTSRVFCCRGQHVEEVLAIRDEFEEG